MTIHPAGRARLGLVLAATLGTLTGLGCGGPPRPTADRIVLVTFDTTRADHVGCYGDAAAHTPGIDSVAAAGVRFETAISPAPLTLPSHTTILTGLDPPSHGVRENSLFTLDPSIPTLAERLHAEGFATAAFVGAFVLDSRFGLDRGFDTYGDDVGFVRASRNPSSFAERHADAVVDDALAWLEKAPDRFFLWVHLYDPHADYRPPPRFQQLAGGDAYSGEIAFADSQLQRLLRSIRIRWGPANLAVVVTADHGESLGQHDERTHGLSLYDATQHVPLVMAGPGLPVGRVVRAPVRLADVTPTILALAGARPLAETDGRDLLPLVRGEGEAPRTAYLETLATQIQMGWSPLLGVRTADFKYIRAPRPELYDLRADPGETHNLYAQQPERAKELSSLLDARIAAGRPPKPNTALDDDERARLEALGYLAPDPAVVAESGNLGVVGGPDPKDHLAEFATLDAASRRLADGDGETALALLAKVSGEGRHVRWLRAKAAATAGRGELAVRLAEAIVAQDGSTSESQVLLGVALMVAGRTDEAEQAYVTAQRLDPTRSEPLIGLGAIAETRGDLEAAAGYYAKADATSDQPGPARMRLALANFGLGHVEQAEAQLASLPREIILQPAWVVRVADALDAAGKPGRALDYLRDAARENPDSRSVLSRYAPAAFAAGDTRTATAAWRRAYELEPTDPAARNDLAWGLAAEGRELDRALTLARQAAEGLGEVPPVLDTLAAVHLARGEAGAALAAADRALAAGADASLRPHLQFVRASALAALGRDAEARSALARLRAETTPLGAIWRGPADALAERLGAPPLPAG